MKRLVVPGLVAAVLGLIGVIVGISLHNGPQSGTPSAKTITLYGYLTFNGVLPTVPLPVGYPCGSSAIDRIGCDVQYSANVATGEQKQQACQVGARRLVAVQGPNVFGPSGVLLAVGTVVAGQVSAQMVSATLYCGVEWRALVPDEPVYQLRYGSASVAVNRADADNQINFTA